VTSHAKTGRSLVTEAQGHATRTRQQHNSLPPTRHATGSRVIHKRALNSKSWETSTTHCSLTRHHARTTSSTSAHAAHGQRRWGTAAAASDARNESSRRKARLGRRKSRSSSLPGNVERRTRVGHVRAQANICREHFSQTSEKEPA
jgi:hypothetical protein